MTGEEESKIKREEKNNKKNRKSKDNIERNIIRKR